MGAWIEIDKSSYSGNNGTVAPNMGAWIEIKGKSKYKHIVSNVAPNMGAWIEIDPDVDGLSTTKSHPTWVRGLK